MSELDSLLNTVSWYNRLSKKVSPHAEHVGLMSNQKRLGTMSNYITRLCPVCNKEYQADTIRLKHGRQTTCSRECSYKFRASKLTTTKIVNCDHCGKLFEREPAQIKKRVFCSHECYVSSNNRLERDCPICGNHFRARNHKRKYCSRACFKVAFVEFVRWENNPSYIDGRSLNHTYDAGIKWHDIRREVYKRDGYVCQKCGVKCVSKASYTSKNSHLIIQCHHIDPYKKSHNNDLSNLVTLCLRCHRATHNEEKRSERTVN